MVVILIRQNALTGPVGIVPLAIAGGPQETDQPRPPKDEGNGDQEDKNVQERILNAFNDTTTDDPDMASAAMKGVTNPASATGTAIRL